MPFDRMGQTTGLLSVYGKMLFLLIHFLVVEDYELSQSTSYLTSMPLTLEYVRILSWSISFDVHL